VAESIVNDYKRVIPSCVYLDGEYGQSDICIGVPAVIGKNGVEKIVKLDLNAEEKALFEKSADAVRSTNEVLKEIKAL
jgi:malate dehydrogenase